MSPIRGLLLLFLLLISTSISSAVVCAACEGDNCTEGKCTGDYCIQTTYNARWGSSILTRERRVLKGCMSGKMIANKEEPHCMEDGDSLTCICKDDYCTSGKAWKKEMKKLTPKKNKVECDCEGSHCKGEDACTGDLCTYVIDKRKEGKENEVVTKGCMDFSVPVVERRMIGSCMQPPMTGAMHHGKITNLTALLKMETCICATDMCNRIKPQIQNEGGEALSENEVEAIETQKCNFGIKKSSNKTIKTPSGKKCKGEFCYVLNLETSLGSISKYEASGCATFNYNDGVDPLFTSGQIAIVIAKDAKKKFNMYEKLNLTIKGNAKKRLEEVLNERDEKKAVEGENEKGENGETEVYGEGNEEEVEKKVPDEDKEEEEEKEDVQMTKAPEQEEKEEATTKRFVFVVPTQAAIPDESNATMITVFILIILCICVAGITWKFKLHRKLMRANYDTVAGG